MQLRKKASIRSKLAIATSSLLIGITSADAEETTSPNQEERNTGSSIAESVFNDKFSVSNLIYDEEDRVNVIKIQTQATNEFDNGDRVKANFIYDTMSGASPNGRVVSSSSSTNLVTFTTASGSTFQTESATESSNKTWLTGFEDSRKALNLEWEHNLFSQTKAILGGAASYENDYTSYGASVKLQFDFNQRQTSISLGSSIDRDEVKPIGGIPDGTKKLWYDETTQQFLPGWLDINNDISHFKPAEKIVINYYAGITQILNRRSLFQFNFSQGDEDGYLTDPYKQISIVIFDSNSGDQTESATITEQRPDTRTTNSAYIKYVVVPNKLWAFHLSYRYFWDSWDIQSHTGDAKLRFNLGSKFYIQAHARESRQSAANFFKTQITVPQQDNSDDKTGPTYISSDHRLGEQNTSTVGLKFGIHNQTGNSVSIRVEQMRQKYINNALPNLKVWIAQLILSTRF